MTYPIPTNPPWVMGSSLLTVGSLTASLETVFGPGNPPIGVPFPSSITGIVFRFDAAQIVGVSSGASLSVWTDVSGQGVHVVQASAGSQPIFVTNVRTGNPVVRFSAANKASLFTSIYSQIAPVTYFFAGIATDKAAGHSFFGGSSTSQCCVFQSGTGIINLYNGASIVLDTIDTTNAWEAVGTLFGSSATARLWTNGTSHTSTAAAATPSHRSLYIGANEFGGNPVNFHTGDIGEFFGYNRVLTVGEIGQVFTYLGSKWGITIT